jgi:hypothetical protein
MRLRRVIYIVVAVVFAKEGSDHTWAHLNNVD